MREGAAAVAVVEQHSGALPATPYRGIQPFRYVDHAIFFARDEETRHLASLVVVYRGVMLYGDSGNGKSSLINAGLLPEATQQGLHPERIRVQPRRGEELVVERIATADDDGEQLPSLLAGADDESRRIVLSTETFEECVRGACEGHRPLLVFDQFEELLTLFEDEEAKEAQRRIVDLVIRLLREPLPVKLLFVFREDYLGKVKQLLAAAPELVDQAQRLGPPAAEALPTIIRGPFERYPDHFEHELTPEVADPLCRALAERFGTGDLSLSEVQTVCLRLWQADDPARLLAERGVQGLLEDYLGEALDAFPPRERVAAVALLSQMVTSEGTRNVISAEDLVQRVRAEEDIPPALLERTLERLESESKLVRRERRRDIYLYEITSEFLVPWISRRREEFRRLQERERELRRLRIFGSIAGALLLVVACVGALAIWALGQRNEARRQTREATALVLASAAENQRESRPDVSLLLGLEAYRMSPRAQALSALIGARETTTGQGVLGILHGHNDFVWGVAFSRDRRTLASASADGTVRLWDIRSHRPLGRPLRGHSDIAYSVAFSRDGRTLASASADKTVRLWDLRSQRPLGRPLRGHTGEVNSVAFSPDGRALATANDDKTVRLWDVKSHRPLGRPLSGHSDIVESVAFSPNGRTLASASDDKTVRRWDVKTQRPLGRPLRGHSDIVYGVAFSPNGRTLASASADETVRLWDVKSQRPLGRSLSRHSDIVESVAFSPDGRTLASASDDKTVRLWDVKTQRPLGRPLRGHNDIVYGVAFSPGGRTIASASADETVRLWDINAQRRRGGVLSGHSDVVYDVAFSPDGRTIASASADETVRLWDINAQRRRGGVLSGHSDVVYDVAFSPDGRKLASAGREGTARLWDAKIHRPLGHTPSGHDYSVLSVAFSPDGRTLASASADATVRLWDVKTQRPLGRPLRGHSDIVYGVAFSPNGRTLASASADETVRLWDVKTQRPLGRPLRGHKFEFNSVAFSHDGRTLATANDDKTVRLWDVKSQRPLGRPLSGHSDIVYGVAFSPNGRMLASASADKTVRLWDVKSQQPLGRPLRGHSDSVESVAFSPDGRTLASASDDETVRLWDGILWHDLNELQRQTCKLVGTGLSRAEWARHAAGVEASGVAYRQSCP